MNKYCVYKHTAPNGKVYIGITKSARPEYRWKSGYGYEYNEYFARAIKKYGWKNFQHDILFSDLSEDDACIKEKELIAEYKSCNRKYGFNLTSGGEHYEHSEESKQKIGKVHLGRKHPPLTEEQRKRRCEIARLRRQSAITREKISKANIGKHFADEALRKKMSENRKGKGTQPRSLETRRLISLHHAGGTSPKKVLCVETNVIYDSINDAVRATGIQKGGISKCCRKVPHYNTAGGFHWKYCEVVKNHEFI